MTATNRELVEKFIAGLNAGLLPDVLFTDDMTVWATSSGVSTKATYQNAIKQLKRCFKDGLHYQLDSLIAEGERAAAEVKSHGIMVNGEDFAMSYGYFFTIRDGRIATIAEHINPLIVQQKLLPLFASAAARNG